MPLGPKVKGLKVPPLSPLLSLPLLFCFPKAPAASGGLSLPAAHTCCPRAGGALPSIWTDCKVLQKRWLSPRAQNPNVPNKGGHGATP